MITLVGPGGAGKTTVGALTAERLGVAFVDLDRHFNDQAGDILTAIVDELLRSIAVRRRMPGASC